MNNTSSKTPQPSQPDDGFWSALFNQEDRIADQPIANEESDNWIPIPSTKENQSICSETPSPPKDPWQIAQELFDNDETVELTVTGHNKGGLLVDWNELQGFIPASQLLNFPQFHLPSERLNALNERHGKKLTLKIIELNSTSSRLIFSERAALVKADEKKRMLNQVEVGQVLQGEVTNLTRFGAFVDLGGIEGLIHISEFSWSRVSHPSQIVAPGQAISVQIIEIDAQEERIALSIKRLKPNPWQNIGERYAVGDLIRGPVSSVVHFGAFVKIEDELEGLVHISELAEGSFLHPRDVVRKGEMVSARIIHIDGQEKKLALSMRGVDQKQSIAK